MPGSDTKLKGKVLSASPTSSWLDEDNELHTFEDVRLSIQGIEHGDEGAGRVSSGEIVITVPSEDINAGDEFEAVLTFTTPDPADEPQEPSTLRQDPEEVKRGRKGDGELGDEADSAPKASKSSAKAPATADK